MCPVLGGLAAVLLVLDNAFGQPEQPPAGAQGAAAPGSGTQPAAQPPAPEPEPEPVPVESPTDPAPPEHIEQSLTLIRPGIAIKREFDRFAADHNMRLAAANTILFQQASGGPGERWAGGGDLDLLAEWVGIGKGTKDAGSLNFHAEYRYQIGVQPPAELGADLGTLLKTTNGFGERPMIIKELYWDQHLFDDQFRFVLGRVNPEILLGGHKLQSSELYFLNQAFSVNPTVAFPQPGLGALGQVKPASWLRVSGGITDANASATSNDFEEFFHDHEFLEFGELALTPTFEGLGAGRYRFSLWHIDAREDAGTPSDRGFTFTFDQDLTDSVIAFTRYGHADGDVTRVTDSVQAGVAVKNVLWKDCMFGAAAAWSAPKDNTLRDEKTVEVFQRFQLKDNVQLTIDAQAIFDPSNAPGDDLLGVFSVRLRVSF